MNRDNVRLARSGLRRNNTSSSRYGGFPLLVGHGIGIVGPGLGTNDNRIVAHQDAGNN